MRTTSRIIAALALALGATGAVAQTPPGAEGGSGTGAPVGASPPPPAAAQTPPAAPPPIASQPAAPAPSAPPALPPAAAAQQGTPATVLDTSDYESLLGRSVRSAGGDELGRVIDIIIDKDGHPRAAIIDFGGFLGVGTRKIAVDWRALRFASDGKERRLSVALTRNQVRVSPEYKSGEPIVVLGPASGATPPEGGEQAGAAPAPAGLAAAPAQGPTPVPPPAPAPAPAPAPPTPAPAPVAPPQAAPQPPAPSKAPDK
ncbi:PRC-barrel domain-containing protein [Methylobacterium sp. J-076]|uniref:PRC-barrel domain-containing protein n=1 Tax=Methylobacterium sp. J-076 TaxID=2836655 RepID=UPI001FB90D8C|nr:PRC-barrel domain-containing protein [Methylobacterium sp. J-076]MCJ2014254.1 PRC-barrel domain-containing protein [Methylobacterium sp. J-076]